MKTITFKELIELIEQDKAPKRIRVNEETFNHEGNGQYFSYRGSPLFSLYNLQELINDYYIEIPTEPLLTDEEKIYLKAVIKPYRDRNVCVYIAGNIFFVKDDDIGILIKFVISEDDFTNMVSGKDYTLEELGLE